MRKLLILSAISFASSATQAAAAEELRITSAADAAQICDLVETGKTSSKVFVTELPAAAFRLTAYSADRGELAIDQRDGFLSPSGLELIEGGLVPAPAASPKLPMRIPATADEAAQLAAAHRAGTVRLEVWFRTVADGPACAPVHRGDRAGTRFAITPIAFALKDQGRVVVRGETSEYTALHEAEQPVVEPVASVAPVLAAKGGPAPSAVSRAAKALAPALTACYRAGLAEDPTLRGSLVAGIVVDKAGRVTDARLELDALGVSATTACALREIRAARFPKNAGAVSVPVKFAGR
jgi:hypothetical protein